MTAPHRRASPVDIEMAREHLTAMWGQRTKGYVHVEFKNKDDASDWQVRTFPWPLAQNRVLKTIAEMAGQYHCFYCPNVMQAGGRSRGNAARRPWVWLDQDRAVVNAEFFAEFPPTRTVDSGSDGNTHRFWRVDDIAEWQAHQQICWGIGQTLGCGNDKITDNDLFRVPGTFNFKHDPPVVVRVAEVLDTSVSAEALSVAVRADSFTPNDDDGYDLPPPQKPSQVPKTGTGLHAALRDDADGDGSGRYKRTWRTVALCSEAGYSLAETLWLMRDYAPGIDKYEARYVGGLPVKIAQFYKERELKAQKEEAPTTANGKGPKKGESNAHRNTKTMWTHKELMAMRFDPMKFTVRGLIGRGATLLIGAPKVGKSFWLLNLVLSVASGRQAFGHFDTRATGVLYLYLEGGGARSIQSRIVSQSDDLDEHLPIVFATEWDKYDDGGIDKLDAWLTEHPDVGLVVVDTLAAFRAGGSDSRNPWKADYAILESLSKLGHTHDCAIVVAHHDKKGEESDFVNSASGTKGLSAACDGIIKLERDRNCTNGKMKFVGRELEDGFWNVVYEDLTWKVVDAPPLKAGAETLKAILDFVGGRHVTISEIVAALAMEHKPGTIRQCVYRAKRSRRPRLIQDEDGRYYQP